ncbi:cycloeucalenol cycloisomerase [Plectosphaerella cucumerina]|uniref:Cycloeucalenol cycloisomerase n=1 Tax=Plectosphaerella cucumerina TaxID=40658 RepID=A0A8K0T4K6_9PEZI|nr:cycloeucalenol cycloisomerase [Plectosphaerella cucumerina]
MARQSLPKDSRAEKSLTERAILAQSPLWMAAVGWVMLTGRLAHWSDTELLVFSSAVSAPALALPAYLETHRRGAADRRGIFDSYWFRLNVWVFIVVCWGTYFGTHYFFDLMGMRYNFSNVRWTLDAQVLGSASGQTVPLFMYPLTHAYFMTYFTVLLVAERVLTDVLLGVGADNMGVGRACIVLGLSYVVAFLETFFMAAEVLSEYFSYADRGRMLRLGSLGYAMYFIAGLPMARRIDGDGSEKEGRTWTLERTAVEAAATCIMIQVLLEVWARVAGPL